MSDSIVNEAELARRRGFYCEDCDKLVTGDAYPYHNSDHTLREIKWKFK